MPDSSLFTHISNLARGSAFAVGMGMATALLPGVASGAQIPEEQLSAIPMGSSSATFDVIGMPDLALTVTELSGATMQGSNQEGSIGLWLGAGGDGGTYQFTLSKPVTQVSLSFVALTSFGDGETESLSGLTSDRPSIQVPNGEVFWDGSTVTPLTEDSRGSLQWVASTPQGFSQFGFVHNQPVNLAGWVIQQISLTPLTPVPEPTPLALLVGGGLALWQLRRRQLG